jgi:hypothetical protein
MKIKLIGLGQCGSFVVYDILAFIFDAPTSKALRSSRASQWQKLVSRIATGTKQPMEKLVAIAETFFTGRKVTEFPYFFVIDGNRDNKVIDGIRDAQADQNQLQAYVKSLPLSNRNNGCALGEIGEYYFRREKKERIKNGVFDQLGANDPIIEANIVIFAGAGGSGSGGAVVLNDELSRKDTLLINMLVLPPFGTPAKKLKWNVGRCITRLATTKKHTALLLFSNLSEELDDQYTVNQYVRELIIRMVNFGYPGNVPKIGTDVDRMDLKAFFVGKPAFVGMSSLESSDPDERAIETWADQALKARQRGDTDGLSIEVTERDEKHLFSKISKVMAVVGVPVGFDKQIPVAEIIRQRIANRLDRPVSDIDCELYSYGSLKTLELTIFLRHDIFRSNFLLAHFLDYFFSWYKDQKTEYEYLASPVPDEIEDTYIEEVRELVETEVSTASSRDKTLEEHFGFELKPVK